MQPFEFQSWVVGQSLIKEIEWNVIDFEELSIFTKEQYTYISGNI